MFCFCVFYRARFPVLNSIMEATSIENTKAEHRRSTLLGYSLTMEYRNNRDGCLGQALEERNSMKKNSFDELIELVKTLRGEDGCPWDRKQTLESLKKYVIEEAYEVVEAISQKSFDNLKEELGDLLFQIVFLSHIAHEEKQFTIIEVIEAMIAKMKYRHPHVFKGEKVATAEEALGKWNEMKMKEKKRLFESIPKSLPALIKAFRISEKAAAVGFDWQKNKDVLEKLDEERRELQEAIDVNDQKKIEEEIGDMLFVLVNISRKFHLDPEEALNHMNKKFIQRFTYMEDQAEKENLKISECAITKLEQYWSDAKDHFSKILK